MMCSKIFLKWFLILLVSRTICASSIILGSTDNQTAKCSERKCIPKCCESGKYLNLSFTECYAYSKEYDFQNLPVYDSFTPSTLVLNELKNATMGDIFYLVPGKMNYIKENNMTHNKKHSHRIMAYLTKDGEMYKEVPNAYSRWTEVEHFCVEYAVTNETTGDAYPVYILMYPTKRVQDYYYYYLITSCVFLVLVLLVYMILPELRNLGGMILMAYISSLLMWFILLAIMKSSHYIKCIEWTASLYFFVLASFCWMNVMSVDIWWTFRGYAKARPIHRRGERFKFCMYCLYGWGVPGIMTIGLVVVNEADLSHIPWIIQPLIGVRGCFLQGGQRLVYMYIPMLFLILSNWLFFLMTAYNIRRLVRGTDVLNSDAAGNPAAHQQQRNRLMLYLKLSVVMGINWLLEVVQSFFTPKLRFWEVSDTYNLLTGFAIFLIFVCKKEIYKKLVARFYELRSTYLVQNVQREP